MNPFVVTVVSRLNPVSIPVIMYSYDSAFVATVFANVNGCVTSVLLFVGFVMLVDPGSVITFFVLNATLDHVLEPFSLVVLILA